MHFTALIALPSIPHAQFRMPSMADDVMAARTQNCTLAREKRVLYNNLLTLLGFLIYKDWLLPSLDDIKRSKDSILKRLKVELQMRLQIYKQCKNM